MKSAFITGITGQDGSYMAEFLLSHGYKVVGGVRDINIARNKISYDLLNRIELVEWDFIEQKKIVDILKFHRPDEIYNYAAYSSGAGMYDNPIGISEVNGLSITKILEAIRYVDLKIRLCQASSREVFGAAIESPQSESTVTNPRSPYGAAKLYADSMIRVYRQYYGLFACSAILFNHESPRRGMEFVTRKITYEAAKIKLGLAKELYLGNLDAHRDWGFAGDTVEGMWLMLQQNNPDDYVLATGVTHTVREFCECAFGYLGLNYKDFVKEDLSVYRSNEPLVLVGNPQKAKSLLGWEPRVKFNELVEMMVDADLGRLKKT